MHRGLGGTIEALLSSNSVIGGLIFTTLSLILLAIPLCLIVLRLGRKLEAKTLLYMTAILVLSPQTFLGWSRDLVRTDLFVLATIAWAVLATLTNRRVLAIGIMLVGFLVHETAVIFGAPVLFMPTCRPIGGASLAFAEARS